MKKVKKKATAPIFQKADLHIHSIKGIPGVFRVMSQIPGRAMSRIKYGYCSVDSWSIEDWFMAVMPELLSCYREQIYSCPEPDDYDEDAPDAEYVLDEAYKDWIATIDRMIFLLREMNPRSCSVKNDLEDEFHTARIEHRDPEYMKKLEKDYYELDSMINQYRNDCKDEFFVLFSKHFWSLWN